jgi:hypothetical protein
MEEADLVSKITATTTTIDSLDYRTLACVPCNDLRHSAVAEGAGIPETKITTQENLVKLTKRGSMLSATYEAIKYQRLDLFTVTIKQLGAAIARAQLADAINVILKGDGNNGGAEAISVADITYADLVDFWNKFSSFNLTTLIASPDALAKILKLGEFRDAYTGLDFHSTGKLITPFGAELYKSADVPAGTIIGLDKNCALEKVQAGGIVTEYDKLIDRQLERASITSVAGFAKIYAEASKTLSLA